MDSTVNEVVNAKIRHFIERFEFLRIPKSEMGSFLHKLHVYNKQ